MGYKQLMGTLYCSCSFVLLSRLSIVTLLGCTCGAVWPGIPPTALVEHMQWKLLPTPAALLPPLSLSLLLPLSNESSEKPKDRSFSPFVYLLSGL